MNDMKKQLFAVEYLLHGDSTEAAKKIGYRGESARVTGSRLREDEKVLSYLEYFKDLVMRTAKYADKIASLEECCVLLTNIARREETNDVVNVVNYEETGYSEGRRYAAKSGKVVKTQVRASTGDAIKAISELVKIHQAGGASDESETGVVILPSADMEGADDGE